MNEYELKTPYRPHVDSTPTRKQTNGTGQFHPQSLTSSSSSKTTERAQQSFSQSSSFSGGPSPLKPGKAANIASEEQTKRKHPIARTIKVVIDATDEIAMLSRSIDGIIAKGMYGVCNSSEATKKGCQAARNGIDKAFETVLETIPESWIETSSRFVDRSQNRIISNFEEEYGIPKEDTTRLLDNTGMIVASILRGGKRFSKVAQKVKKLNPKKKINPPKIDSDLSYLKSAKDFASPPKEFNGCLKKDLYVVRYHGKVELNTAPGKWFMPVSEANKLSTLEEVLDRFAILNKFGEKTHVTVVKIPKDTPVRFLYGKASKQFDILNLETRLGGGIQYRFKKLEKEWIVKTREIPKTNANTNFAKNIPFSFTAPIGPSSAEFARKRVSRPSETPELNPSECVDGLRQFRKEVTGNILHYKRANQNLMQMEREGAADCAFEQIRRIEDDDAYNRKREYLTAVTEGIFGSLKLFTKGKTIRKFETCTTAFLGIMDSCRMFAKGSTLMAGTTGLSSAMAAFAPTIPYLNFLAAVAPVLSLFKKDKGEREDRQMQALFSEIQEFKKDFTNLIVDFHGDVMQRFDGLQQQIESNQDEVRRNHLHTMRWFLIMQRQMRDFSESVSYSLTLIENDLQMLQTLDTKIDHLLLRKFTETCSDIEEYENRYGPFGNMEEARFTRYASRIEKYLLGISLPYSHANGSLYRDYSSAGVNKILSRIKREALLGYLGTYAKSELGIVFPASIKVEDLPNLMILSVGLECYLDLRTEASHADYDREGSQLQKLLKPFEQVLTFVQSIKTNRVLFERLLSQYKNHIGRLQQICFQEVAKKNQEIMAKVKENAKKLNDEAIKTLTPLQPTSSLEAAAKTSINTLSDYYDDYRKLLNKTKENHLKDEGQFTIDIAKHKRQLLAEIQRNPMGCFVVRHSSPREFRDIPLVRKEFSGGNSVIEESICSEVLLAEKLNLGQLEIGYKASCEINEKLDKATFKIIATFRVYQGPIKSLFKKGHLAEATDARRLVSARPLDIIISNNFMGSGTFPIDLNKEECIIIFKNETMAHRGGIMLRSAWQGQGSISPVCHTKGSKEAISELIDATLIKHRREVIGVLYQANTELGVSYRQALEDVEKSYNLLQAFAHIAGFNPTEMQNLNKLLNLEKITQHQQPFLNQEVPVAEDRTLFPESDLEEISLQVLSRFAPNAIVPENSTEVSLQLQLAKIGSLLVKIQSTPRIEIGKKREDVPTNELSKIVEQQKILTDQVRILIDQNKHKDQMIFDLLSKLTQQNSKV